MIEVKSYGKINLSLEIIGKRPDGYHNIDSLMEKIDLYDTLSFRPIPGEGLILKTNQVDLATDSRNLVHRAWEIMSKFKKTSRGLEIFLKKNIPLASGLAGGTSNGVTTMKFLNEFWQLGLGREELIELSKDLGADASFFYYKNLVRARGIGDQIEELPIPRARDLLLINIGKGLSSGEIYQRIKTYSRGRVEKINQIIQDTSRPFPYDLALNDMEKVSFEIYPELAQIKKQVLDKGAQLALMSGSGPTIFGLFEDRNIRDQAYSDFLGRYSLVLKSKLI